MMNYFKKESSSKQLSLLFVAFLYSTSIVDVVRILGGSVLSVSDTFVSLFRNIVYILVFLLLLLNLIRNKKGLFDFLTVSAIYTVLISFSILITPAIKTIVWNNILMVFSRIIPAFIIAKHCDVQLFLKYLHKSSPFLLFYTIIFVVFGVNSSRYYYMNVGYNILFPSLLLLFYKKNLIDVTISIISLLVNLLYCARGSILIAVVAIVLYVSLLVLKKKNGFIIIPVGLILIAFIVYLAPSIIEQFYKLMPSSRTLRYLITNQLFDSSGRDVFYSSALFALSNNPLEIRGLLGDRIFYSDILQLSLLSDIEGAFAHNVFLEISLQFGIIVGIVSLLLILYLFIKPVHLIFKTKHQYQAKIVVYCALIVPCFAISMTTSSYLSNFELFLMLGLCQNLIGIGRKSVYAFLKADSGYDNNVSTYNI